MSEEITEIHWGDFNYVLLDAAAMGVQFAEAAVREKRHHSLYSGSSATELAEVAPYLFQFETASSLASWLLPRCQGKSWATFLQSAEGPQELRRHLRKFLMVRSPEGKDLYYRYYDPRVLRDTLPTFDTQTQREIMGPIEKWLAEAIEPGRALCFQWHNLRLRAFEQKWSLAMD